MTTILKKVPDGWFLDHIGHNMAGEYTATIVGYRVEREVPWVVGKGRTPEAAVERAVANIDAHEVDCPWHFSKPAFDEDNEPECVCGAASPPRASGRDQ